MTQRLSANGVVLVTGATGFIGSHLVEGLLQSDARVLCVVRPGKSAPRWIGQLPVELVRAPLSDVETILAHAHGVRTIIHVAGVTKAKRESTYRQGNVETTRSLLDVARRLPHFDRFCFISSLTVSGPSPDGTPLREEHPANPLTAYARSKWEAEQLVRAAASTLPVTIIRPPTVYGPRDRDVLEMFRWVRYGLHPVIGGPHKTLSVVHVQDLVRGIVAAAFDARAVGRTYNIAERVPHRYDDLIQTIANVVGRTPVRFPFPTSLLFAVAGVVEAISFVGPKPAVLSVDKARDMVQSHWVCNPERIESELGVRAMIGIEEGFRSTYEWYRSHGWL